MLDPGSNLDDVALQLPVWAEIPPCRCPPRCRPHSRSVPDKHVGGGGAREYPLVCCKSFACERALSLLVCLNTENMAVTSYEDGMCFRPNSSDTDTALLPVPIQPTRGRNCETLWRSTTKVSVRKNTIPLEDTAGQAMHRSRL